MGEGQGQGQGQGPQQHSRTFDTLREPCFPEGGCLPVRGLLFPPPRDLRRAVHTLLFFFFITLKPRVE